MPCHSNRQLSSPALVGDPVDVTSGANTDITGEFSLHGAEPFKWQRYYSSLHHRWHRALGWGHTHEYDHQLQYDVDGLRYITPDGEQIGFDALFADGKAATNGGYRLTRVSVELYRLWRSRQADELIFVFRPGTLTAVLTEIQTRDRGLRFRYNDAGHLVRIGLPDGRSVDVRPDDQGRVTALFLNGTDKAATPKPLIEYRYDSAGNLVSGLDAYRNPFSFRYDRENRMVARTDRRGYSFLFEYDDQGWCVRAGGEDGVQEVRLRYLRPERVTIVAKPDGGEWTYFYNEFQQLTQIIDPLGGARKFEIDEIGVTTGEMDANGNLTRYVYSPEGDPVAKVSPIGIRYGFYDPPPPPFQPHRIADTPQMYEYGESGGPAGRFARPLPAWLRKILTEEDPSERGEMTYDAFGLTLKQTARSGAARHWGYDANGNVARIRDFSGATYNYDYASWNHAIRRTDPLGASVRGTYTKLEKLASITDENGVTHEYAYNLRDQVTEVRRYGKLLETYEYDAAGNLIRKRDGSGNALLTFKILPGNLIGTRELASGDIQKFEYDDAGRILKAASQTARIEFAYDEAGHRVQDRRDGAGVTRQFKDDRLQEIVVLGSYRIVYRHQPDGSVVITDPTGGTHRLTFPGAHVIARELSNGSAEYTRYDADGNVLVKVVTRRHKPTPWIRKWEWSPDGDLLGLEDNLFGTSSWSYDPGHRLREMTFPDKSRAAFYYDPAGNLLQAPGLADVSIGQGNQLVSANGTSLSYDLRGRLVEHRGPQGPTTYEYDSRDMLIGRKTDRDTWRAEYDALGRRVRKESSRHTVEYYWDTDRLAAEKHSTGHLRIYVYADAIALTPFLFIDYASRDDGTLSATPCFVFSNHIGAPILLENQGGEVVWRCTYTPYGAAAIHPGSTVSCSLRFPGHYFDEETGLHYNRFRYYSPELGRYLQMDPEGIEGGLNLYAYTSNPLVEVDVRGLACNRHRGRGSRPNCEDCRNLDAAAVHILQTAEPGVITSRGQLVTAAENRAAIARLGMAKAERGPNFTLGGFLDGKSTTFAHVNHDTPPPKLHPLLEKRLANPPEGGFRPEDGVPGSHSEIWTSNDAMWEREEQQGRPLTEDDLNDLHVQNEKLEQNSINREDGVTRKKCCSNCSHILPENINTPGRTTYPGK